MATPEFIRRLRADVGHELLFLSAVLAVVIDDRRVLMVRRTDTGQWTIPGGILEPGEFAADAVERELLEETGLHGKLERLLLVTTGKPVTYPNGDQCQFLLMSFQCTVTGGTALADGDETSAVQWFSVDALPADLPDPERRSIELAIVDAAPVLDRQPPTSAGMDIVPGR